MGRCISGTLLLVLLASGCGGPRLAPVTGTVTYGGKPVTQGKIMFYPDDGRMATAEIGADGTFTLTTFLPNDGALVGTHRVAIHSTRVGQGSIVGPKSIEEEIELSRKGLPGGRVLVPGAVEWLVPERYSLPETSGLIRTVEHGPNILNIDLPAEP